MKGTRKTTTYSLDWDIIVNLESRLLRDFQTEKSISKGTELLMISIGSRLGLRVIDNLSLKWRDLIDISVGERFIRIEKKTDRERILIMSSKLREVIDVVYNVLRPNLDEFIFTSQKGRGKNPMTTQTFNRKLKSILSTYRVRYIGNCSSHLLRKSWVVGTIKKGFENGDHLSLVKVSRLIGHSNVTTTLRYTNFEVSQSFGLFELD
jgi:site-specific recombinase XerD